MKRRIRWENKNFDDMGTLNYLFHDDSFGSVNYFCHVQGTWEGTFNNLVLPKGGVFFCPER